MATDSNMYRVDNYQHIVKGYVSFIGKAKKKEKQLEIPAKSKRFIRNNGLNIANQNMGRFE